MLAIAVLAAGKGTRMKSDLAKVLHPLAGTSLIERVLSNCNELVPERRLLIIGHLAKEVKHQLKDMPNLEFVMQSPQKGTGHAIQQLIPKLRNFEGELLVLNGDVPLLRPETIKNLLKIHKKTKASATFLATRLKDPKGYGRVFLDKEQNVINIVEERDCNAEQRLNRLTNSGIYCFNWGQLSKILTDLTSQNSQNEIYLTESIKLLPKAKIIEVEDATEVMGVNDCEQLSICETIIQDRLRSYWMKEGVTFIDPKSCTLSEKCQIGKDVVIEPQTHLRGNCKIGDNCHIGPGTLIENSSLGKKVSAINSVIRESTIADNVKIGPFAHLRPKSDVGNNCQIGNFVEIKKSNLGEGSKINHLSYIGDTYIGSKVNIGAGTITANYDGINKHKTIIGNNTKTGANTVLIAPINLGSCVTVGAGSIITKNVPDNSLALGRAKQLIKREWLGPQ